MKYDLFRVTTNLILFRETGVLDRELNLASIPYMGSPEGLSHCCLVWYVPSLRYTRGLGWRMHCGAEVTESSTNIISL